MAFDDPAAVALEVAREQAGWNRGLGSDRLTRAGCESVSDAPASVEFQRLLEAVVRRSEELKVLNSVREKARKPLGGATARHRKELERASEVTKRRPRAMRGSSRE